ncbi:MAG: outer membrane protein OmpA-like peptidoglycan-associated protein [Saprospiraceae bacterium]
MTSDESGAYEFTVSGPGTFLLSVDKKPYFNHKEIIVIDASHGKSVYLKHALKRNSGYIFEITIAEKDPIPDAPTDALKGALVEVYNNTKREEVMVIEGLEIPEFKVDLLTGNHHTLLIRKEGFLSKRMEAFVDVEGCILCFEGIGSVNPGVSDNLTEENSMGVLLANVEMDRYFAGKVIGLNDIYYDFGKSKITKDAAHELRKVTEFLKDNPNLKVELGSHTDSRGGASANISLSEKRARSAVEYLVNKGGIIKEKIAFKGYGETILTNNCGDGVQCTDEEHRLNRRTELKVLDVINEGMQR